MVGLPSWNNVNLRVGRRQVAFEFARPAVAEDGELVLQGFIKFAHDHSQACEIARMHRRDWFGYVDSQEVIPVVSDDFPEVNGFYVLDDLDLPTDVSSPFHEVELELVRVGSYSDLRFESALIGTVKDNDFSITENASEPMHAPPPHTGYEPRHATSVTRGVAYQDDLTVYRDVPFSVDPKWSARPEDWYTAAATVSRRDPLWPQYGPIASTVLYGHETIVEDVEIGNGMVRFWMLGDGNATIGFWDGTAWRDKPIFFVAESVPLTQIDHMTILRNSPDRSTVRYYGTPASGLGRVSLDLSVRRGDLGVSCLVRSDASTTLGVQDTASTNMTVTSNRMVYSSADANGHKLMFATMHTFNNTAANGLMYETGTTSFDVFIGMELSGAAAGNQAADLAAQYAAALNERIREVPA